MWIFEYPMGSYGILLKLPGISGKKSKAFIKADGAAMRDREASLTVRHMKFYSGKTCGKNIAVNQKYKIDILYVLTTQLLAYHLIFASVVFGFVSEKKTTFCDILRDFFSNDPVHHCFFLKSQKNLLMPRF